HTVGDRLAGGHGVGGRIAPGVMPAGGEAESDLERVSGERRRCEPLAETLQHGLEHPREHAERVDLPLEPLRFLPEWRRSPRPERIGIEAERQIAGAQAGGAEPRWQAPRAE